MKSAKLAGVAIVLLMAVTGLSPTASANHATANEFCSSNANVLNPISAAVCSFFLFCHPDNAHNSLCRWRIQGTHIAAVAVEGEIDTNGFGGTLCGGVGLVPSCSTSMEIALFSNQGTTVVCRTTLPVIDLGILASVACGTTAI